MEQSKWETELNASLAKNDDLKTAIVSFVFFKVFVLITHFKFTDSGDIPKEKKSYTGFIEFTNAKLSVQRGLLQII